MFCEACAMCTGETGDQSNCVQLPRDIMCLPIGSMLLRSKILWMKHVVFWREPDGVIPRATGDWLTGRWDSRKVLRHCHNTWKTSTYARRCWSSRFWHSDWKSGLFPDFYRKYSKVRTFPGPGGQQLKIRTFPGNKDPWEPCITQWHGQIELLIRQVDFSNSFLQAKQVPSNSVINDDDQTSEYHMQGSFCVCPQPMRDHITL